MSTMNLAAPDPDTAPAEPLLTVGVIAAAAVALLALLVAFGVPVTNGQQAAVLGVLAVLAPPVTVLVGRGRVWSPRSVTRLMAATRTPAPPL